MKIKYRCFFLTIFMLSYQGPANAWVMEGKVIQLQTYHSGIIAFQLHGQPRGGDQTGCATVIDWFVIDQNDPGSEALLSNLMLAAAAGKTIRATGAGKCNVVSNFETVHNLLMFP